MLSRIHHKIRTTPWLGRLALGAIPDLKWHLRIDPIGRFAIRLREHRMFWLRPPLILEGFMLGSLSRLVQPGDVVYDVGANIGLYSRFLVQCFKASRVYAFEPMEENRRLLAENAAIAGCAAQVEIVPCAVGDQDGTEDFQIDDLTSNSGTLNAVTHGRASQSRSQYGLPPKTMQVKVTSLDTFVQQVGIAKPQVIKLDIEGAEALALRGANRLLAEHGPHLVIELHGADAARQVVQILWDHDYHCFGCLNENGRSRYKEVVPGDLCSISQRYSLHFLAASRIPLNLIEPIENFSG